MRNAMNLPLIQTILTLKRLKINDKTIENILSKLDIASINYEQLQKMYQNVCLTPINKSKSIISESLDDAWNISNKIINISYQNNVKITTKYDKDFPALLKNIPNSPLLLHVKGNTRILNTNCIAVVGTRTPTDYGKNKASEISEKLTKEGFTVVSGLAKGIDSAAHEGALKSNGFTIAVLAHGLQTIYPAINRELASRIVENNGALISEHPWDTPLESRELVKRDRIQSGISLSVFVIETGIKGGTMHTVNFCKAQNRFLTVLKHPEKFENYENIKGNSELIKNNAKDKNFLIFNGDDDVHHYTEVVKKFKSDSFASATFQQIESEIKNNPLNNITIQEPQGFTTAYNFKMVKQGILLPEEQIDDESKKNTKKPKKIGAKKPDRNKMKAIGQKDLI